MAALSPGHPGKESVLGSCRAAIVHLGLVCLSWVMGRARVRVKLVRHSPQGSQKSVPTINNMSYEILKK